MGAMTRKAELTFLAATLALGAFFRFYQIAELPPGLWPDEAVNGTNALEALRTGDFKIFYPENNGREGLFINLQAIAIAAWGAEPWVLRVVSAIFGTLTVLGLYLLVKELFPENHKPEVLNPKQALNSNDQNRKPLLNSRHWGFFRDSNLGLRTSRGEFVALLSAFFLATSYWHINFSRIGFRAILVPFFSVFAAYWLLKALRTGKISSTVLAGLAAGLGFHTYLAFRFMPFVFAIPVIATLASWWRGRRAQPCVPCVTALFLFIALVAALPLGLYFLERPEDFFGRTGQVSIFSSVSPLAEFARSNLLTLGMFNVWGDCNARHNFGCRPELSWPVGIFFLMGFVLAARAVMGRGGGAPRRAAALLLAWFALMTLPATLTREGLPHALRAIGLIPPVMIFAGLGAARLFSWTRESFNRFANDPALQRFHAQLRRIQRELALLLVVILLAIAADAYRAYFLRFAASPNTADAFRADLLSMARYAKARSPEAKVFVLANYPNLPFGLPLETEVIQFVTSTESAAEAQKRGISYLLPGEFKALSLPPEAEKVVLIPLNQKDRGTFREIRERFPHLKLRAHGEFLAIEN